ncbi:MAG: hypothetical protein MJZ47_03410 [Bacteroidales bacterium]|nr:hypothetical protein [Bacteroidales bacterium]
MKNIISNIETIIKTWKFSLLDMACGDMIIKAVWIFNTKLDTELMGEKLSVLLGKYPFLAGRLKSADGISCSNEGCQFDVVERQDIGIKNVLKSQHIHDDFSLKLNIRDFKAGKCAPMTVCVTSLSEGAVLSVQMAHICMDGRSFYKMMNEWGRLCRGENVDIQQNVQFEFPNVDFMTKPQTAAILEKKKWTKLGFKDLVKMLIYGASKDSKVSCTPLLIDGDKIKMLKAVASQKTGCEISTNSVMSAVIVKMVMNLNGLNGKRDYSLLTVADIRGRYKNINADYIGNASNNIVTHSLKDDCDVFELARRIQENVGRYAENKDGAMDEYVDLCMNSLKHKLPYVAFDLPKMNSKKPTTVYVNDQHKLQVYDLDFGNGKPVIAFPNDLPDMVKIWPANDGKGSVLLFFKGYLAKNIIRNGGVDEMLKEIMGF